MNALPVLAMTTAAGWLQEAIAGDGIRWLLTSIGDHLVQATLFTGLILVATWTCPRAAARTQYLLWLLAAAKFALPSFAIAALMPASHLDAWLWSPQAARSWSDLASGASAVAGALAPVTVATTSRSATGDAASWPLAALGIAWIVGVLVVATALSRRWIVFRQTVSKRRVIASGRATLALVRAARRHGLRRAVPLVEVSSLGEPAVLGIVHPVIALPEGIVDRLGDHDLEMIFLHELAHVRRRDNLVAALTTLLCALLWFWPIVWWVHANLLAERERACDEDAVLRCGRPEAYLASLLEVCRWSVGRPWLGAATLGGSNLGRRAESIVELARAPGAARARNGIVGLAAAALVMISLVSIADSAGPRNPIAVEPSTPRPDAAITRPSARPRAETDAAIETAFEHALTSRASFENAPSTPVAILSAAIEIGSIEGETLVGPPTLRLANRTARSIDAVRVRLRIGATAEDVVDVATRIAPHGVGEAHPDRRTWWNRVPRSTGLVPHVQIDAVRFSDGTLWGANPRVAQRPREDTEPVRATIPARVEETPHAPLRFTSAGTPVGAGSEGPFAEISNPTAHRVVGIKLRFKSDAPSHAVMARNVDLPPNGRIILRAGVPVEGNPAALRVQLIGVRFEDGSMWGDFDGTIDARQERIDVPTRIHEP